VGAMAVIKELSKKEEEVITFTKEQTNPSDMSEVERLREENKRLKRTLLERFDDTFN